MDLGEHAAAGGGGLVEQVEVSSPDPGRLLPAEEAERDRASGLDREVAQPDVVLPEPARVVAGPLDLLGGPLEDPRAPLPTWPGGSRPAARPASRGSGSARS